MNQMSMFDDKKISFEEAQIRIDVLRKEILYHNNLYYTQDKPEISDYDYDMLMQELKNLEAMYPKLITKSSPTQVVGNKIKNGFKKVNHDIQMQSLNDVFSYNEVEEFVAKLQEEYGKIEFVVETKIDGLSVSLEYVNGELVRGSTRGDGTTGEDVTENLLTLKDIPKHLNCNSTIEYRGEVYLSREQFQKINKELQENNKPIMANPRNAAAGTLRQLDSTLVSKRGLNVFVFNVQKSDKPFKTHSESLEFARNSGVGTIKYTKIATTFEQIKQYIDEIGELRETLPYDIDGAVVKINDLKLRETIGKTSKVPKWAVAYKYPPKEELTKIEDILLQVGRTGQITPLAKVTPTPVAGSVISKCTLHNFDYINEKDIRINDMVFIRKAGDVIPEVAMVDVSKRTDKCVKFVEPKVCPVCQEPLERDEEVALRCTNSECEAQIYRAIVHFCSRDCMNIDGMGEKIVEQLIEKELVKDVGEIYNLTYEQLLKLEGFKDKSANNLIEAINKSKNNGLDKLLFGLGIRHIGKRSANMLAKRVDTIYDLYDMTTEELQEIDDFGEQMAESVIDFFKREKTHSIISRLAKSGVNLNGEKKELLSSKLSNLSFCITGSFENVYRSDIVKKIEENGGKVLESVSKNTSYLIAGEASGSKKDKAVKLNIPIVSYQEFLNEFEIL